MDDPFDIPKILQKLDDYINVGKFISEYNLVEMEMKLAVSKLLNVTIKTAEIIMASTRMMDKWSIFDAVNREKITDAKMLAILNEVCSEIQRINSFRNDLVHGIWMEMPDGSMVISRTILTERKRVPLTDIPHYIHALRKLTYQIICLDRVDAHRLLPIDDGISYEIWRDKRLEELHRDLSKLGPSPPTSKTGQPPKSPHSPPPGRHRRPSSAQKRSKTGGVGEPTA